MILHCLMFGFFHIWKWIKWEIKWKLLMKGQENNQIRQNTKTSFTFTHHIDSMLRMGELELEHDLCLQFSHSIPAVVLHGACSPPSCRATCAHVCGPPATWQLRWGSTRGGARLLLQHRERKHIIQLSTINLSINLFIYSWVQQLAYACGKDKKANIYIYIYSNDQKCMLSRNQNIRFWTCCILLYFLCSALCIYVTISDLFHVIWAAFGHCLLQIMSGDDQVHGNVHFFFLLLDLFKHFSPLIFALRLGFFLSLQETPKFHSHLYIKILFSFLHKLWEEATRFHTTSANQSP